MTGLDNVELHEQIGVIPGATSHTCPYCIALRQVPSIRVSDDGDYCGKPAPSVMTLKVGTYHLGRVNPQDIAYIRYVLMTWGCRHGCQVISFCLW